MTITTKRCDYTDPSIWVYDDSLIEIVNDQAKLVLQPNPGQTYDQPYTSDTDFTYDSDELSFTGTQLEQLSQGPANSSAFANYETDEDFNWSDSALDGTLFGGATVTGGALVATGGGDTGVSYVITGAVNAHKGAIRMAYTPNYTGNPASDVTLFDYANTDGASANRMRIRHDASSAWRWDAWSSTGSFTVNNQGFASKTLTAGTTYIVEFNWDFTPGSERHEMFIDGAQQGSVVTRAVTRSDDLTSVTHLQFGGTYCDASFQYNLVATEPLNTAPHTAPTEPSAYRYAESLALSPDVPVGGSPGGGLLSVERLTTTQSANVKFTFGSPSAGQFWYDTTLSTWRPADGTYTQSNTAAEMETYLPDFPFDGSTAIFSYATIFPQSANTQEYIDDLSVEYTNRIYPDSNPSITHASTSRCYVTEFEQPFTESATTPADTAIRYIFMVDGTKTYWDGAAWSASDGTYTQANSAATVNTNIATLLDGTRAQVGIEVFLHSTSGAGTPISIYTEVDNDAALPDPTNMPDILDINGFVYDCNLPMSGVEVYVRPYQGGFNNPGDGATGGIFNIYEYKLIATSVDDGFFSGGVFLNPDNKYWEFKFVTPSGRSQSYRTQLPTTKLVIDFSELSIQTVVD